MSALLIVLELLIAHLEVHLVCNVRFSRIISRNVYHMPVVVKATGQLCLPQN